MPRAGFPGWQPHPDVWIIIGGLVAAYAIAVVRLGPRYAVAGRRPVTNLQLLAFCGAIVALLTASDYPIHDIAERYLYSVHMLQHLLFSIVAAPLLLIATPAWMADSVLRSPRVLHGVRRICRFLPATILFNAVLVITHVPAVVDLSLRSGVFHFTAHAVILVSSLLVWMPILSPTPAVPRFTPPLRMLFLFMQSMLPTVPASFLAFGDHPLYPRYATFPRLWGVRVMDDMRVAGLVMKIGAGTILWVIIGILFFRWYAAEEGRALPQRVSRRIDRELSQIGLPQP